MEYTQNYALRKPGLNEYANVGDLNFNADKIDSQMKKNQDVDGEVYDPTSTSANAYEAGDYVINPDDGLMYVCNGTTYGTWDATKWDHTTEFEELQKAMASGGESELADLHDVDITTPTDGQALLYDDTTEKWHNSDLPDADVTKEASGNPIEFSDGADAPLVKCVTQITGSQDLHGYDKPWVGGAGKNKLLFDLAAIKANNTSGTWNGNVYTYNGVTYTVNDDGTILVNGATGSTTDSSLSLVTLAMGYKPPLSNIILSDGVEKTEVRKYGLWLNASGYSSNPVASTYYSEYQAADLTGATWSSYSIGLYIYANATLSNVLFKPMIRLATVTDPTFAPYSNICPITAYTEGEIEVSDGDGNVTTHTTTYPSAIYRGSEDVVNGAATTEWGMIANYAGETLPGEWISDRDEYAPGTTPTTGAQVAYELATPTTSPVTPTNLPIKSLSGYNHIESSTGEMEIEYFPQKEQPLIDLIPEASNMHEYSTAEHAVGTWIDGSTVYEKTYTYSGNVPANPFETTIDFTGKQFLELIPHYAKYTYDGGSGYGEVVGSELLNNYSEMLQVQYYPEPYTLRVHSFLGNATESYDIAFTLRYTKTSSNNRSLKSAPTEETKEEQVEELKEEPEEVKEEPVEEVKEEVKEEETKDPETNEEEAKR